MSPRPLEQRIEIWPVSRIAEWARNPRVRKTTCGDGTGGQGVARRLRGRRVRLLVTEMPGGVQSDSEWRDCVDVVVRRWQKLTGEQGTLDGDGRSFEQVARELRRAVRGARGLQPPSGSGAKALGSRRYRRRD